MNRDTGAKFRDDVRRFLPMARRFLVEGTQEIEEEIEDLLKRRGDWSDAVDDEGVNTVCHAIRQSFLLGVAYGHLLNGAAVLHEEDAMCVLDRATNGSA